MRFQFGSFRCYLSVTEMKGEERIFIDLQEWISLSVCLSVCLSLSLSLSLSVALSLL